MNEEMLLKIVPKKEKLPCPVCGKLFEKYIKDTIQTCSRACGGQMRSLHTTGTHKKGKKIRERDEEREQEDAITHKHRQVFLGVDCQYGEGDIV